MSGEKVSFGEYIEAIRKLRQKSLRKTAQAIGISPQFYSEVEKGRRPAFTADRLEMLKNFLQLTPEESEQMYNKAAESGYVTATNNIAHIYLFRNTKYKDIPKGLEFAFKAANTGDEESQNALGLCYEEGIGVEINYEEAFKWYSLAVKNGAGPCALHNLARCYREGKGVAIDKRKANYLDKQAKKLGYK